MVLFITAENDISLTPFVERVMWAQISVNVLIFLLQSKKWLQSWDWEHVSTVRLQLSSQSASLKLQYVKES